MKLMLAAAAAVALAVAPAAALAKAPPGGFTGPQPPGGWGSQGAKKPGYHPSKQTGAKSSGYKNAGHLPGYGQYPSKKHPSHPGYKKPGAR